MTAITWALFGLMVSALGLGGTWIRGAFSDLRSSIGTLHTDMNSRFDTMGGAR